MTFSKRDFDLMNRALLLAQKPRRSVLPNPKVGAVIVHKNKIVGEGFHQGPGTDHGEIAAIRNAERKGFKKFEAAEIFINLEPCSHLKKRTPPCAPALAQRKFKRVVISHLDPNPLVSGRGIKLLKKKKIKTEVGLLKEEALQLNQAFIKNQRLDLPYITLKIAMTFDGRMADDFKKSKWITGEESRSFVHRLRSEADAIAVGRGTIDSDNPSLNIRGKRTKPAAQKVIIFGRPRRPIASLKATKANGAENIITLNQTKNLRATLRKIYSEHQVCHLFVEGGPTIATRFIEEDLVDRIFIFYGRGILGGRGSFSLGRSTGKTPLKHLRQIKNLKPESIQILGNDVVVQSSWRTYE